MENVVTIDGIWWILVFAIAIFILGLLEGKDSK